MACHVSLAAELLALPMIRVPPAKIIGFRTSGTGFFYQQGRDNRRGIGGVDTLAQEFASFIVHVFLLWFSMLIHVLFVKIDVLMWPIEPKQFYAPLAEGRPIVIACSILA